MSQHPAHSISDAPSDFERILRDEIVPIAEELKRDPSLGIPIDEVRDRFRARHAEAIKHST